MKIGTFFVAGSAAVLIVSVSARSCGVSAWCSGRGVGLALGVGVGDWPFSLPLGGGIAQEQRKRAIVQMAMLTDAGEN